MTSTKITPMRLTKSVAQKRIREIAVQSGNVILGTHAKEQMANRGILRKDVDRNLRQGYVEDDPRETDVAGEWKCKMVLPVRGRRDLGVVVILLNDGRLFVKTTEWEDPR